MSRFIQLTCLILLFTTVAKSQSYIRVTGNIKDSKTDEPIGFAHVGIPSEGLGTTSGDDGLFTLKIPREYKETILTVSFLGYTTYKIPVSKLDGPIDIKLERSATNLTEIVVVDENRVVEIVKKAIKNIPNNYPTKSVTHRAFYRESMTDSLMEYKYLAEGVINVYTKSYKNKKAGLVSLEEGRLMNLKNPLDTATNAGLTSGHMAAHRFDFVKQRREFLSKEKLEIYNYRIENITTYNDRPVFIIGFEPNEAHIEAVKKKYGKIKHRSNIESGTIGQIAKLVRVFGKKKKLQPEVGRMKGRMFIDTETFAIIRGEFEVTEEGLSKIFDYPFYAGDWNGNKYVVNYRQIDGTWYLSDALREGIRSNKGYYINEIKLTHLNIGGIELIPYENRIARGEAFTQETGNYEDSFWKSFNTTPLKSALAESVRQSANIVKASEVFDPENMEAVRALRDSISLAERTVVSTDEKGNEIIEILEPVPQMKKRKQPVKFNLGIGTHLIKSNPIGVAINYYDSEVFSPTSNILSISKDLESRNFEVIANLDVNWFLKRNWFLQTGMTFDFANSINKELSVGLGRQIKLTRSGRPFYFRGVAGVDRLRYARKVGQVKNEYGKFEVNGKKFNAKNINLYYGNRIFNAKFSAEFSMEINRAYEVFVRGTYYLPFSQRTDVWFWERKTFPRKRQYLPATDRHINVVASEGVFIEEESFSILVGFLF